MSTFPLSSKSQALSNSTPLSNPDWINLYLAEPSGMNISDFPETVNLKLRSCPTMAVGWTSDQLNQKFRSLLSQFGRFWIKQGSDNVKRLYYRTSEGLDVCVNDLMISNTHRVLIVRVNGKVIPTLCLAQLKILLEKYGQDMAQVSILSSIRQYWSRIEDYVERHRTIFNIQ